MLKVPCSFFLSVGPLVMTVYFRKTAQAIELPFRVVGHVGSRNDVINRVQLLPAIRGKFWGNGVTQYNVQGDCMHWPCENEQTVDLEGEWGRYKELYIRWACTLMPSGNG